MFPFHCLESGRTGTSYSILPHPINPNIYTKDILGIFIHKINTLSTIQTFLNNNEKDDKSLYLQPWNHYLNFF